jgi:molybdopterin converting factor small subunit
MTTPAPVAEITVLYFAAASTATGCPSERIVLPDTPFPLRDLARFLSGRYPGTILGKVLERSQWSVDAEMVSEEDVKGFELKGGEEIGVICPVSGG